MPTPSPSWWRSEVGTAEEPFLSSGSGTLTATPGSGEGPGQTSKSAAKIFEENILTSYHIFRDREWRKISDYQKNQLGLTFDDDGEFYMNFNRDFLRYFGEVEIVHKTPAKMLEEQSSRIKYEVFYFRGEWSNRRGTAGGCGNDSISTK